MVDVFNKGMIHILRGTERNDKRFRHSTQNNAQVKTYRLCISGIFNLILSDCS